MPDALSSSYAGYGTNSQRPLDSAASPYVRGMTSQETVPQDVVPQAEATIAPQLSNYPVGYSTEYPIEYPIEAVSHVSDQTVAEFAIRRLSKEIEHAQEELQDLEKNLVNEMLAPAVRTWLLPLMAVGLALSLYGSMTSSNSAELGATGLMLLWSLGAFWYIYTRERKVEVTAAANRAELEIWSSRIAELEQSLDHHQRVMEATDK